MLQAFVAQLDRVSDFGSEGYRFESYRAYHSFMRQYELVNIIYACHLGTEALIFL